MQSVTYIYHEVVHEVHKKRMKQQTSSRSNPNEIDVRQSHVLQINGLLKRASKFCYVKCILSIEPLLENFDDTLLNKAIASNHTMHHLLPNPKSTCYSLRSVGLGFSVDFVRSELHKKTFINHMVFKDCY